MSINVYLHKYIYDYIYLLIHLVCVYTYNCYIQTKVCVSVYVTYIRGKIILVGPVIAPPQIHHKRRHGMRTVFLNNEFLSFICKFIRNFHNKPNIQKIPNIFQERIESDKAN